MEKQTFKARVGKVKLIPATQPLMAYVLLILDDGQKINGLLVRQVLTFMMEVAEGDTLSVYGHYNSRAQFVIERYLTAHKGDPFTQGHPAHLHYPHRKKV